MKRPLVPALRAKGTRCIAGAFAVLLIFFNACADKSAKETEITRAISDYERARHHVLEVYDAEITAAQRPGGAGLNSAKQLAEEKARFLERIDPRHAVTGFNRDEVVKLVSEKTWHWHWEQRNRERPFKISIDERGDVVPGTAAKNWKLELRWILIEGGHILVPVDDYTLRGFFIASGRQVGAFADKPK